MIFFCTLPRLLTSLKGIHQHTLFFCILIIFLLISCIIFIIYHSIQAKHVKMVYGQAHFANEAEIKKMGCFGKEGLLIGKWKNRLLRAPMTNHGLVFAPSGSGKSVSWVIPNALSWPGSLICTDLKFEVFKTTSGFRAAQGQAVYCFAPTEPYGKTHRWNPLTILLDAPFHRKIADCQLIVETLIPMPQHSEPMWVEEARSLALGLLLWLLESDRPKTLGELANLVKGSMSLDELIQELMQSQVKMPVQAEQALLNFLQKAPKEQSGVRSTLAARLRLWEDPIIDAATAVSDFDCREIRRKPMTLYLGLQVNQIERLAPLMNLFIQQFLTLMTEQVPNDDESYHVLALLDEFCNLGYMPKLKASFSYLRGFNVHLMPVIQNIGQFYDLYGGRDACDIFFQNTDLKIACRQNTQTDRQFLSKLVGHKAVKIRNKNYTNSFMNKSRGTINESYQSQPLLSPEEIGAFPQANALLINSGNAPIRFKRLIYYNDSRLATRILSPVSIKPIDIIENTNQCLSKVDKCLLSIEEINKCAEIG